MAGARDRPGQHGIEPRGEPGAMSRQRASALAVSPAARARVQEEASGPRRWPDPWENRESGDRAWRHRQPLSFLVPRRPAFAPCQAAEHPGLGSHRAGPGIVGNSREEPHRHHDTCPPERESPLHEVESRRPPRAVPDRRRLGCATPGSRPGGITRHLARLGQGVPDSADCRGSGSRPLPARAVSASRVSLVFL